ncbi:hypothetical protein [Faecalicatena contorta]|uniref:hypothetical protein n=1 Tax=Faecalicatena contorta TaxID=39482 RepID=UPI0031D5D015
MEIILYSLNAQINAAVEKLSMKKIQPDVSSLLKRYPGCIFFIIYKGYCASLRA